MKTVEAAKGQWAMIFEHYGLPPITGKNHFRGKCPLCDSVGKFRIDDRDGAGTWICTCGSGTGMDLVTKTQGKPFNEVCREIDALIGNTFRRDKIPEASDASKLRKKVLSNFAKMSPLRGTCAAEYLNSRGIYQLPAESVRLNPKQRHNGRVYQSIYSLATDDKGELCYLHQTLLDGAKRLTSGPAPSGRNHCRKITILITLAQLRSVCSRSPARWASQKESKPPCLLIKFTR